MTRFGYCRTNCAHGEAPIYDYLNVYICDQEAKTQAMNHKHDLHKKQQQHLRVGIVGSATSHKHALCKLFGFAEKYVIIVRDCLPFSMGIDLSLDFFGGTKICD